MKATLKEYRQSPRKVRLLADLVRGKSVQEAETLLAFAGKRAAGGVSGVLRSAVANAKAAGKSVDTLYVAKASVDAGPTQTRFMPRARGSAAPIRRRTSHISLALAER